MNTILLGVIALMCGLETEVPRRDAVVDRQVNEVFELPKGVVLDRKQREEYDKMRKTLEPRVREALTNHETARRVEERVRTQKELVRVKSEVKQDIARIVTKPPKPHVERHWYNLWRFWR